MGELARRRRDRDLWVSKGHLMAAGVGTLMLAGVCFGAGLLVGGRSAPPAGRTAGWTENVADPELVDLLARVDASAAGQGGVGDLTFPDALRGEATEHATPAAGPAPDRSTVLVPGQEVPVPEARFTVAIKQVNGIEGLTTDLGAVTDGLALTAIRRAGVGSWRVELGQFSERSAAEAAQSEINAALSAAGSPARATVSPLN